MNPQKLQPHVPFELDLYADRAYVTLVAFRQEKLRLAIKGCGKRGIRIPTASHAFLNVRTYVRYKNEPGIYFIAEWVPNFVPTLIAPRLFGLPYRMGKLDYRCDSEKGDFHGEVCAKGGHRFEYQGGWNAKKALDHCAPGGMDEFLLERYVAFNQYRKQQYLFRIWHEPWPQIPVEIQIADASLLSSSFEWFQDAELIGANYSPGIEDVWIGPPRKIYEN